MSGNSKSLVEELTLAQNFVSVNGTSNLYTSERSVLCEMHYFKGELGPAVHSASYLCLQGISNSTCGRSHGIVLQVQHHTLLSFYTYEEETGSSRV